MLLMLENNRNNKLCIIFFSINIYIYDYLNLWMLMKCERVMHAANVRLRKASQMDPSLMKSYFHNHHIENVFQRA